MTSKNSFKNKKEQLAKAIVHTRKQKKISQQELANKSGVSIWSIRNIEWKKVDPRFFTVSAIAEALECTIDKLIECQNTTDSQRR